MIIETCIDNNEISLNDEDMERYNALAVELGVEHLAYTQNNAQISPMNRTEKAVYEQVCENKIDLEKYNHHIPERVLLAMQATKEYLENLAENEGSKLVYQVWVDSDPDPILVAKIKYGEYFLIGRWGTELDTFNELRKRAIEKIKGDLVEKMAKAESLIKAYKDDPDTVATMKLNNQLSSIYF